MTGKAPDGQPVPHDGELPAFALTDVGADGFGVYIHVPFCVRRCGYCDFNTYAVGDGVGREGYIDSVIAELALAERVLHRASPPRVETVFVGGGTPTVLPPRELARLLERVDQVWGIAPGAEITTEANPESVDAASLRELRSAGYNRISLGAQSVAPNVLAVLERRHAPERPLAAAAEARDAGFEHVNLDLIYGTPGESPEDFAASLRAVISAGVDHVSAYALTVEDGTPIARAMRAGALPYPDDDVAADRYLAAEETLSAAGFGWYEVSNWALGERARCRHNLAYWSGGDWWGLGPGAHSHIGGVRWWNVAHPSGYRSRLDAGVSPGQAREILTENDRYVEAVMLGIRLADGVRRSTLTPRGRSRAEVAVGDGLLEPAAWAAGAAVLTLRGRLLADEVTRRLLLPDS